MKSIQILKNVSEQKFNLPAGQVGNKKKENALDIISKSFVTNSNSNNNPSTMPIAIGKRTLNLFNYE